MIKEAIKGFMVFAIIIVNIMWVAWIFVGIWRGYDFNLVFNSIITATLCLLCWLMMRQNERLMEEKNYWKQEYNDLVARIFNGEIHFADKPLFNVGDWIISKSNNYFDLITNYEDGYYECESSGFPKSYEGNYRLWELTDAKPGNVLYDKSIGEILLFKSLENQKIKVFCDYSDDKRNPLYIYNDIEYYGKVAHLSKHICPANEAQRKLLFDEMKNMGYELISNSDGVLNLVKRNSKEE